MLNLNNPIIFVFIVSILIPYGSFLAMYLYWSCNPDFIPWWHSRQEESEAQCGNCKSKENNRLARNIKTKEPSLILPAPNVRTASDHTYICNEDDSDFSKMPEIPVEFNTYKVIHI